MRLIKIFGIISFLISLLFISCNKEVIYTIDSEKLTKKSISASTIPIPEVKNKRLYFSSLEKFAEFVDQLNNTNIPEFNERLITQGYISYYSLFHFNEELPNHPEIENNDANDVPDEILQTF